MSQNLLSVSKIFLASGLVMVLVGCGGNLFQLTAKKDTPEAIYQDARDALNEQEYDVAIAKILDLKAKDAAFYARCEKVDGIKICPREDLAGAYASKCGLNFVTFVSSLTSSTGSPFLFFMQKFKNVAVSPSHCYEAQKVIETFGATSGVRSSEQNLFMAVLGMAKIGTHLRDVADVNQDGTTDTTYNSCDASSISTDYLRQVISGMGLVIDNVAAVSAVLSGESDALADLEQIKQDCGSACAITDPNSSSFNEAVTRVLLRSSDKGIETSSGCTFPTCCL
ncbi:MAG: hypothetical protein JNL11_08775 [Bdellovibrionaceae bacterium]|nr:hypothetical protein [Pseudobdellovibrionaceae bacterium]